MNKYYDKMIKNSSWLLSELKAVEAVKQNIGIFELQRVIGRIYSTYLLSCEVDLDIYIEFVDIHKIIGYRVHTECAYVFVHENKIRLLFHPRIIEHRTWEAGFVFIYKCWVLLMVILRAFEVGSFSENQFLFEAGDNGEFESVSFCSRHLNACLILDHDFAISNGYDHFRHESASVDRPWSTRKALFFWRGSTTGRRLSEVPLDDQVDNWDWLQRLLLCKYASRVDMARHFDLGITKIVQIDDAKIINRIRNSGFLKTEVARVSFIDYKYVFDIDGNSNAWAGLFCSLYGASCVLKVESSFGYRQWYYDRLRPWKHFVPVDKDLRNIYVVVEWLLRNDRYSQEIAVNGYNLATSIRLEKELDSSADNLLKWLKKNR